MIHWIASYPKSGNTWVRLFLAAYLTGDTFDPNIRPGNFPQDTAKWVYEKVSPVDVDDLTADEARLLRGAVLVHLMRSCEGRCFLKTHSANVIVNGLSWIPPEITGKSIYILRDPRDVAISYADHIGQSLDYGIECLGDEDLRLDRGHNIHQAVMSWSINVESWCRPTPFFKMAVRYEDLLASPAAAFHEIVSFLGLDVSGEKIERAVEQTQFARLQALEDKNGYLAKSDYQERFFRKGTAGQWRDVMTEQQIATVQEQHGKTMAKWGYS